MPVNGYSISPHVVSCTWLDATNAKQGGAVLAEGLCMHCVGPIVS